MVRFPLPEDAASEQFSGDSRFFMHLQFSA